LRKLPRTLDETYQRILENITDEDLPHAIRMLQLIVYSDQPFRLEEMIDALAVEIDQDPPFREENRMPDPHEIGGYCSGLVRISALGAKFSYGPVYLVQLAHFSVREWLVGYPLRRSAAASELDEIRAREHICVVYLSYLLEVDTRRFQNLESSSKYGSYSRHRYPSNRPLARIADTSWAEHARVVEGKSLVVREMAVQFYKRRGFVFLGYRYPKMPYMMSSEDEEWFRKSHPSDVVLARALIRACDGGLPAVAEHLIEGGADPHGYPYTHGTPLHASAKAGRLEVAQLLVNKYQVNLDALCEQGVPSTALALACFYGNEEVIQFLIEKGANLNIRRLPPNKRQQDDSRFTADVTALHAAARGHPQILPLLLKNGADIELRWQDDQDRASLPSLYETIWYWYRGPLEAACATTNVEAVLVLLHHGPRLDPIDLRWDAAASALHAVDDGRVEERVETVLALLKYCSDTQWHGLKCWSERALVSFCSYSSPRRWEIVNMALDYGADVNAEYRQTTAIQNACSSLENAQASAVVDLLLGRGANVNVGVGSKNGTPLHRACESLSPDIVALLLESGADPKAQSGTGVTALHLALEGSNSYTTDEQNAAETIIGLLVSFGADINAGVGSDAGTPLYVACGGQFRDTNILRLLLANGAEVRAEGGKYGTALQRACLYDCPLEFVEILLDNGAECRASGGEEGSATRISAQVDELDVFEMLLGYDCDEEDIELSRQARLYLAEYHEYPSESDSGSVT
jgi:ankyrin repeat protein